MDSDGRFPTSKIKAQLLSNEDVGRVSTKAVELIAACSAVFVNDLARSSQSHHGSKRKSTKTSTSPKDDLVTLAQIKKNVKSRKECSFLDGVIDGVTEKSAFQYDSAAKKKRKRLEDNNNTKQKNNARKKAKAIKELPTEARGPNDIDTVENKALREAIETSSTSQTAESREIIEDEDDYD